jgi:hypothetical protein
VADASGEEGDPQALVEGYEALRAAAVGGQAQGWRHGYGILATRGMAAWMGAWASGAPAPAAGTPARLSDPSTPTPCPTTDPSTLSSLPHAGEIVSVVAQMALAHL